MSIKQFVSGDEAAAIGVKLAKPNVIAAYPITPQTIVVEKLSEYVADGQLKSEYLHVESEHSALAAVLGSSALGARSFTATSAQGLLYMAECLHYVSGARRPIVLMNANRSVAVPWSIFGDHRDTLSLLDCGWIQLYVEDAQEALDVMIQAFKIAEHPEILTPVMVNLDGFFLTHTYELVTIPDQETVDQFLPPFSTENKMDLDHPRSLCISVGPEWNTEFRCQQHVAISQAREKIIEFDREFGKLFGRSYGGLVEEYRCEDAEVVLVTLGTVTGTARMVVDKMREEGKRVGLLKIRCLRPFPVEEIILVGKRVKALGVIDRDISFGYEGAVFSEVNSALMRLDKAPKTLNFVAGLGGRNPTKADIEKAFEMLFGAVEDKGTEERVKFLDLRCI